MAIGNNGEDVLWLAHAISPGILGVRRVIMKMLKYACFSCIALVRRREFHHLERAAEPRKHYLLRQLGNSNGILLVGTEPGGGSTTIAQLCLYFVLVSNHLPKFRWVIARTFEARETLFFDRLGNRGQVAGVRRLRFRYGMKESRERPRSSWPDSREGHNRIENSCSMGLEVGSLNREYRRI